VGYYVLFKHPKSILLEKSFISLCIVKGRQVDSVGHGMFCNGGYNISVSTIATIATFHLDISMFYNLGSCAAGWIANEEKCYMVQTRTRMNYVDADGYCTTLGGSLLTIRK